MKRQELFYYLAFLLFSFFIPFKVLAQEPKVLPSGLDASQSAEASLSAKQEPVTAEPIVEKKEDITELTPQIKGKLEWYLAEHPLKPLGAANFLQHIIRMVIRKGVKANTIVLILLFPLVAAIIAASRHIVGIRGFGIFLPAVLSVVFVSTGIIEGLILFSTIILVATGARIFLRKLRLQYLPRMALLLWFVSLGALGLLFVSPFFNLTGIMNLSIFPVLILILLAENFISIQIGLSMKEAVRMTLQTLMMALICSVVLELDFLQKFVLLKPEITVLTVAVLNIFMGKYAGLRLLEYKKFKELIR